MQKQYGKYNFGIKMQMYPNHQQQSIMFDNIHTSRWIYNQLVANSFTDSKIHKLNLKYPIPAEYWQYNQKHKVIKKSKKRPTQLDRILQNKPTWFNQQQLLTDMFNNTLINYKAAWNMFHKVHNAGTPKFKSRNKCSWSFTISNHYAIKALRQRQEQPNLYNGSIKFIDQHHLYLGRTLGTVKVKYGIKLPKQHNLRITNVTLRYLQDGSWFVSLLLKSNTPFKQPLPKTNRQIGIDLNLENFLMDSNGFKVNNPHYYKKAKHRLKIESQRLNRKIVRAKKEGRNFRDSKRYQQQRKVLAHLHRKIKNQRNNFTHLLSTALIKNHDLVVSENLQSKNLLKNHALSQSIADVGWRSLITKLEYKAKLYNRVYIKVSPRYTTQICHECGYRMGSDDRSFSLNLADRQWWCPNCHRLHIRDWNAAKNILTKGLKYYNQQPLHVTNVYQQ